MSPKINFPLWWAISWLYVLSIRYPIWPLLIYCDALCKLKCQTATIEPCDRSTQKACLAKWCLIIAFSPLNMNTKTILRPHEWEWYLLCIVPMIECVMTIHVLDTRLGIWLKTNSYVSIYYDISKCSWNPLLATDTLVFKEMRVSTLLYCLRSWVVPGSDIQCSMRRRIWVRLPRSDV